MRIHTLSILICDLQGYTERQARSSRADIARDLDTFGGLLRPVFRAFGGEVVKTMGDAFLASFESPTNAVLAAVQVQKQLTQHNQQLAEPGRAMRVRIGIATGEVHRDASGDVFGDAVNLAARLQSSAEPGAVWLAETTFLAMNKNEVQAFEVGRRVFKGIAGEVVVYRVLDDFITTAPLLSRQELDAAPRSIATDVRRPRTVAYGVLAVLLLLVATGTWFAVRGGGDVRPAAERFAADPSDLAAADEYATQLTGELHEAEANGTMPTIYREGRVRDWLAAQRPRLHERLPFQRLELVYFMANEPLADGVAEAVLRGVTEHAELGRDERFVALLRATVDYASKEPTVQAKYRSALQRIETGR